MSTWRSGEATAADLGRLLAVEAALHQHLGAASLVAERPAVVCLLDERSLIHAAHVEMLMDHLPRRDSVNRADLIVLGPLTAAVDQFAMLCADAPTLLLAYREVLVRRVIDAVLSLEVNCSEAAERSLRRSLRMVLFDLEDSLPSLDDALGRLMIGRAPLPSPVTELDERLTAAIGPRGLVS